MDTQGQQQPVQITMSQGEFQRIVALVMRFVARQDDHILSQLLEDRQFIDELAEAVAEAMAEAKDQAARPFIPPEPEWTVEERIIEDLVDEEDMERMTDDGLSFGNSYTRVNRNGAQVLHLLSEYYTESVLEAAKEDDLHPPSSRGLSVSTNICWGDQYAALVHGWESVTPNTLEVIRRNIERQEDADQSTPSLTSSSEPRIDLSTYLKGVLRARKGSDFK